MIMAGNSVVSYQIRGNNPNGSEFCLPDEGHGPTLAHELYFVNYLSQFRTVSYGIVRDLTVVIVSTTHEECSQSIHMMSAPSCAITLAVGTELIPQ